jgi:hypothetical protein
VNKSSPVYQFLGKGAIFREFLQTAALFLGALQQMLNTARHLGAVVYLVRLQPAQTTKDNDDRGVDLYPYRHDAITPTLMILPVLLGCLVYRGSCTARLLAYRLARSPRHRRPA